MTEGFNWVIGLIVIQTVGALAALVWALARGQFRGLEEHGRRIFNADLEADRARERGAQGGGTDQ